MKTLVGDKPPDVEKPGVSPVRREEEIGGPRARLQACGQAISSGIAQVCLACWKLGANRNGGLCGSTRGIPPVEPVFYKHHRIANACPSNCDPNAAACIKMVCYHWNQSSQIEIAIEAPGEVEIALL